MLQISKLEELWFCVPKIYEVAYNFIFIGIFLIMLEIDAPLNFMSMLRFGNGTHQVLENALNDSISAVLKNAPQNLFNN